MITHVQTHVLDAPDVVRVLETVRAHVAEDVACNVQVDAEVAVRAVALENVLVVIHNVRTVLVRAPLHAIHHALLHVAHHALTHVIQLVKPHVVKSVVTSVEIGASPVAMLDVCLAVRRTVVLLATVIAPVSALEKQNRR